MTGFLITLAAVIGLTRFAAPQHHVAVPSRTGAQVGAGTAPLPAARR
jgi:hypothetical protein